jgi:hypothetical protein
LRLLGELIEGDVALLAQAADALADLFLNRFLSLL